MTPSTQLPTTSPASPPHAPAASPVRCPIVINGEVQIPAGITDLDSFRRWCHSADFPEQGRFSYLAGLVWVDLTMEQAFTHNDVKEEVAGALRALVRVSRAGRYFGDGMRLSNTTADLCTDPDGLFYRYSTLRSGQIQQTAGKEGGVTEFLGTPDMILEVVSKTSEEKDMLLLPSLYATAAIPEFWRIDARQNLVFEIFRLTPTGYVPTRCPDGWWRSDVFGREFHLTPGVDEEGQLEVLLESR